MRLILAVAAFAALAACNRPDDTGSEAKGDALADSSNASSESATPPPAPPPRRPSRVAGPPDNFAEYYSERGGITRPLTGEEGGGAAANQRAFVNDLIGRWAFNCNTGEGELVLRRGGRFTAPGGSGRFEANDRTFEVVFTFEDGDSETWIASMEPGRLSLQRQGGGGNMSRLLCSATP